MKPRRPVVYPPCDVCHRVDPGGPCKPHEKRRVRVDVHLVPGVLDAVREHVPYGQRSRWMADAIEARLAEESA